MGHFPLVTDSVPLLPHVRCNPPLAIRKRILWPDRRVVIADEPQWTELSAGDRMAALNALYRARGYTVKASGTGMEAIGESNTVRYWVEDIPL